MFPSIFLGLETLSLHILHYIHLSGLFAELDEILVLMESILEGRADREEELARHSPVPDGWLRIVAKALRGSEAE